jgi:1-acyl-sn-glycerol-3-phosphate acyltransferase
VAETLGMDPAARDPDRVRDAHRRLAPLFGPDRWFQVDVRGWEDLPPGPVLFVSNHSGGTSIPDVWGLMWAWIDRFGVDRPVHALAHDMIFHVRRVGELMAGLGVLRAGPEVGRRVLEEFRRDLFVCPGGDRDTWRPWKYRYKVNFSGRTGYARLATSLGVAVVPVANAGAHETLVVLTDGAAMARRLGFKSRFRAEVFPVHLSLPWGVGVGPLPHIPWPTVLRYRFGAPIQPGSDPEALDVEVRASIQGMLDVLREERPRVAARIRRAARVVAAGARR